MSKAILKCLQLIDYCMVDDSVYCSAIILMVFIMQMEYNVTVESEQKLRERAGLLDKRQAIKDSTEKSYDMVDEKRNYKKFKKR